MRSSAVNRRATVWLAALLAAAMVLLAGSHATASARSLEAADADAVSLNGRQLMQAIYFADGLATRDASFIPQGTTPTAEARVLQRELLGHIQAADPTFFDDFAARVTSGSHVQVDEAVRDGAQRLWDAASALVEAGKLDAALIDPDGEFTPSCLTPTVCVAGVLLVAGWTVVVAVNYGLAINVGAVAAVFVETIGPSTESAPTEYEYEVFIDHVTRHFAGR